MKNYIESNSNQKLEPYIKPSEKKPELTVVSVILGIVMAVIFGGANAYLGLRVGMTVSASIPAAVISMGVIRVILRRDSILENNVVQTIGSAGESLAAGAIFTLPALFMWANEGVSESPSVLEILLISLVGGCLGILFMIPLRQALIVKEHKNLPYPEGKACAEVLLAGEKGGKGASTVFSGLFISAGYKFIAEGLKMFPSRVDTAIKGFKGAGFGIDVLPALAGVGYICGPKVSAYLLAGGMTAWLVIMPLIALFGGNSVLYPSDVSVGSLDTWEIWSNYVRYIGAGAVAAGGIISLMKSMPLIAETFKRAVADYGHKAEETDRCSRDIPMNFVFIGIVAIAVGMWVIPSIPVNMASAVIIILFGFFFATVSSRMVGLVGSSNNPVSGMAIATLLIASLILKAIGNSGISGMIAAITIGTIICIVAALAGDTSQDLKTGYLIGSTPYKLQIGELIGVLVSSVSIGGILYLLNSAWGYGSNELPAPQATLMKMVVEGVMEGNLPWNLVFAGAFIAIVVEILHIPSLPFAVGLYLPVHLSVPIMAGGLIRYYFEKSGNDSSAERKQKVDGGILYSSGLIAGEGLVGILLAIFALIPAGGSTLLDNIDVSGFIDFGDVVSIAFFVFLCVTIILASKKYAAMSNNGEIKN
ncbi:MAG: oligopeptide transporter, OPT family [Clostridia bacterium]|nr:oligopeptide transporter, OPT family [Clostridia bacterium]